MKYYVRVKNKASRFAEQKNRNLMLRGLLVCLFVCLFALTEGLQLTS